MAQLVTAGQYTKRLSCDWLSETRRTDFVEFVLFSPVSPGFNYPEGTKFQQKTGEKTDMTKGWIWEEEIPQFYT